MEEEKQVLFHVGNELYGIGIVHVKGIEKYTNITPIPNAPNYIEGMINLRGEIIPVFSLRAKFGLPKAEVTEETKLIIAKSQDMLTAFQVDIVKEIIEIPEEQLNPPPAIVKSSNTEYIGRIARVKDRLVVLLNLDGVLSEEEREAIENAMIE